MAATEKDDADLLDAYSHAITSVVVCLPFFMEERDYFTEEGWQSFCMSRAVVDAPNVCVAMVHSFRCDESLSKNKIAALPPC